MAYYCYRCNQERSRCPQGSAPGECALVEADAAEYQAERHTYQPMFQTARLRADNASHMTQRELGREIIDAAKRDGREIERAR